MRRTKANEKKRRNERKAASSRLFWRHVARALPFMILAVAVGMIAFRFGAMRWFETLANEIQMKIDVPTKPSDVVIVEITEEDFKTIFGNKSRPLHPGGLYQLIDAIAAGRPCVIGVDIDTHYPEFENFKIEKHWSKKTIWAREPKELPKNPNEKMQLHGVLGRDDAELNEKFSGTPLLVDDDADKVTRRYAREIETAEGNQPSFAWKVYQTGQQDCPQQFPLPKPTEPLTEPLLIRYSRGCDGIGRIRIPASEILKMAAHGELAKSRELQNKIVLLGGSYSDEDKHETPFCRMDGVEILANVIETEANGGGYKPPNIWTLGLLTFFEGVLLVLLFHLFAFRNALLLSVLVTPLIAFLCSLAAYGSLSYWAYFTPIMLGVLVNELWDMTKNYLKSSLGEAYKTATGEDQADKATTKK